MSRHRRRSSLADESLELLLDTICNTFGGVLFIAILLALSARPTPKLVDPDPLTTAERLAQARADRLSAEIAELEESIRQAEQAADLLGAGGMTESLLKVERARETLAEAEAAMGQAEREAEAISGQSTETETRRESMENERKELQAHRDRLAGEVDRAAEGREQELAMPELGSRSRKTEVGLIVQYGRLYRWEKTAGSELDGLNTDDLYVSRNSAGSAEVRPIPFAGIDLNAPDAAEQIAALLAEIPPERFTYVLVVRPDSFASWATVRDGIKAAGGRYRLYAGDHRITDRGGAGGGTQ